VPDKVRAVAPEEYLARNARQTEGVERCSAMVGMAANTKRRVDVAPAQRGRGKDMRNLRRAGVKIDAPAQGSGE